MAGTRLRELLMPNSNPLIILKCDTIVAADGRVGARMPVFAERQPLRRCAASISRRSRPNHTQTAASITVPNSLGKERMVVHELQTKRMKTRRKRTTYYAARVRQANGMIVVEVHADWSNFTGGILMPSLEIEAYDTEEATAIFRQYLKRWIKNPKARSITIDGETFDVIPGPKTYEK